ncbi:MAG: BsuBI/PstI family type II restriction endonuclease [Thermodesulfovibrionales bacterium]|nr:BsuBI/PstI family type II restriction endonuclease [Thermodesulfovibrionales bacterium]
MSKEKRIEESLNVLNDLGMPRAQLNERSALCLLALLNLRPDKDWASSENPLIGITPIMDWSREFYGKQYAPNTRETFRRQTMHQFIQAGIALYNPDKPDRPVNSPHAVYQIEPQLLTVLRLFGTQSYKTHLASFLKKRLSLAEQYAKKREMLQIPVKINGKSEIRLSAGHHSRLIAAIIEEFASRFVPGGILVYVGDTEDKFGYFDDALLSRLGVQTDNHGKMPDIVIYFPDKNWLLLVEAVTSHGPMDGKRHHELSKLFEKCTAGLVFVSAFPDRKTMNKYLEVIAWETEVWIADNPTHLIHFNGIRFLGPYK